MTLPRRESLGIHPLTRNQIADKLAEGTESKDINFIDEVVMELASLREAQVEGDSHRPCKAIHMKASSDALLLPRPSASTELLLSEEKVIQWVPIWQISDIGRTTFGAKILMDRNTLEGAQYKERCRQPIADWTDHPAAVHQQHIDAVILEKQFSLLGKCSVTSWTKPNPEPAAENGSQYSFGLLINWKGHWFLHDPAYVALVEEKQEVPHHLDEHVLEHPGIQQLFEEIRSLILHVKERLKLRGSPSCIELTPEAFGPGGKHIHGVLDTKRRKGHDCSKRAVVTGTKKNGDILITDLVPAGVKTHSRKRHRASTKSRYDCQAEKVDQVMHGASKPKSVKHIPDEKMINPKRRRHTMTKEACKVEALLSRDKVPSTLTTVDTTKTLEYLAEKGRDAATANTVGKSLPFKEPTKGELEWLNQHGILATKPCIRQHRAYQYVTLAAIAVARNLRKYKFLIYDGLALTGKKELACNWFGSDNTLICHVPEGTTPNMRPFLSGKYSAVVFVDGNWSLCYQNKNLMQASPRPVELEQSHCNEKSYQVLLYKVPLIVCSNDFWGGCTNNAAKEWIEQNSIYIRVDSQLWVNPDEAVS